MRLYRGDSDYWRIRSFLQEIFILNRRLERSWQPYRFDYCRWHAFMNFSPYRLEDSIALWEAAGGRIAGVVIPEGRNDIHFQIHPDSHRPQLAQEMIEFAESSLFLSEPDKKRSLTIWAHQDDPSLQAVLRDQGYSIGDEPEFQRRRWLSEPVESQAVPSGFTVRSLGDKDELPARSWASWRAFHPASPDSDYEGWSWYLNVQKAPLYRRDLDIVSVADGGQIASFCTVWFDEDTRTGAFEPVGTPPEYQRRGLGKAVMTEGLNRLLSLGATMATVSSYTPPAHALYTSMGFEEYSLNEPWEKVL